MIFDPRQKPERGTYELDRDHVLARGMVAYWPFDEGAGRFTANLFQHAPDAVINSSMVSQGFNADGASSYVDVANENLLFGASRFSITFRVFPRTLAVSKRIISKWGTVFSTDASWIISIDNSFAARLIFGVMKNGSNYTIWKSSANHLPTGAWCTITVCLDGHNLWRVYQNGVSVGVTNEGSGGTFTTVRDCATGTKIGGEVGNYFNGLFDFAAIHRRALSASEVKQFHAEPYAMLRPLTQRLYSTGHLKRRRRVA